MGACAEKRAHAKYQKGVCVKKSEIDAVVKLRRQGLIFDEIARRLNMSADSAKRRYYARDERVPVKEIDHKIKKKKEKPVTLAVNHPELIGKGPKILFFDIETAPTRGWVWRNYEDNLLKTDQDWYMLSYAYKWADSEDIFVRALPDYPNFKKNMECDKALVTDLWALLNEADIIVAHNGDAFDIKKTNARLIINGLNPPATYKTIDTLKIARRHFKFSSNRLNELGQYLGVGEKLPHTGAHLWFGCMRGEPESWELMKKYNIQDVRLLEKVYYKLRGWMTNHPNVNLYDHTDGCPKCQSTNVYKRGFEVKLSSKRQRFQCQDCGGWFSGGPPIKKQDPLLPPLSF
jgi:uncharacterized protein YprB with RNaseH-like and TPR domain